MPTLLSFFEAAKAKNRWTVTTLSCIEAEIKIRTLDDLKVNKALTADITRKAWRTHLLHPHRLRYGGNSSQSLTPGQFFSSFSRCMNIT